MSALPQERFVETFVLIYAEANAVGTLVMAHDIGAARETVHTKNKLIDGSHLTALIARIKA